MKPVDEATIREMVSRLAAEFSPEAIILFGSRAWGAPDEESDVDLLVVVSESEARPVHRVLRARRCLRGIPVPKDVIVRTSAEVRKLAAVPAS
ncbi:MAG: nucleotidyltransferase domain-containing protein, partial [Luteolibacter sp.]